MSGADIENREGERAYDVHWAFNDPALAPGGRLPSGLTCVFRVKDESRNLPWVLPPMLRAVQHVVLVDNRSEDGTLELAQRIAAEEGATDRFTGLAYPFQVARAGSEHRGTPADSVHSLTHFYNWSFSQVRTSYSMKWDGDMVLTPEGEQVLGDLAWQLEGSGAVVAVPRHPLTVVDEQTGWIDLSTKFLEPWVYPMGPDYTYVKAFDWEVREFPEDAERVVAPEGLCVELKWIEEDEFAHWSDTAEFSKGRSPRKLREWRVDRAIREGRAEEIRGLVRVEAPAGVHIVDHVLHTWLPQAPRPLVGGPLTKRDPEGAAPSTAVSPEAAAKAAAARKAAERRRQAQRKAAAKEAMERRAGDALYQALKGAVGQEETLVLVHEDVGDVTDRIPEGCQVVRLPHTGEVEGPGGWGTVLLVAPDRDALRRGVSALPRTRVARRVGIYLEYAEQVPLLAPRPEWPRLLGMQSRADSDGDGFSVVARFAERVPGHEVLAEFGRQAVRGRESGHHGLRVAVAGDALAPAGEVDVLRLDAVDDAADPDLVVPPDVVISPETAALPAHDVIGRAPVVLGGGDGVLGLGPLDERILNPIGWQREVTTPAATLDSEDGRPAVTIGEERIDAHPQVGATEAMSARLAGVEQVRLTWPAEEDPAYARTVAGLAMAGVPLVSEDPAPGWATRLVEPGVLDVLAGPGPDGDDLSRELYSVRLRRAALSAHSTWAWRRRVADRHGLRIAPESRVSVVMASKRPEQLEHAVGQVARQRGADLELVLIPHGWQVDEGRLAEVAGALPVTVLPQGDDVLFGDALTAGVEAASGDLVMKMDDDDWYGPDMVADLLQARRYSGADLVGVPFEFIYLTGQDVTVRRFRATERFEKNVAGGSTMLPRDLLRELGGFRPARRFVDASLLADVLAAGGSIYRAQGLGYLFRRGDSGHTWQADSEGFLDPEGLVARWDGFRPNPAMEL